MRTFACTDTDEARYFGAAGRVKSKDMPRSFLPVWTTTDDCSGIRADGVLWPVQVHRDKKTCRVFSLDQILVCQLWAEAKKLYEDNEPLTLDAEAFSVYTELYGKGKADEV